MTIADDRPPRADGPPDGWVPWRFAELAFVPELTSSIDDILKALEASCRERVRGMSDVATSTQRTPHEDLVIVSFPHGRFEIDLRAREFCFLEADDDETATEEDGFSYTDAGVVWSGHPDEFQRWDGARLSPGAKSKLQEIKKLADFVWSEQRERMNRAIRTGTVVVCARIGSPLATFSALAPDQWLHFAITDREMGSAKGPGDETLYSIHLASTGREPDPNSLRSTKATAGAEREAKTWLVERMRSGDRRSKKVLWPQIQEALGKGRISQRGFLRAWAAANLETESGWTAGGRHARKIEAPKNAALN